MIHPVISDTVCPYSGGRRYYSLNDYCKEIFKEKVYRLSLSGGMSCPNRDGTCGTRGCIFCSEGGSGDFAASSSLSVADQLAYGKDLVRPKYNGHSYIAYFQAYTNTYAPVDYLAQIYRSALNCPDICGISIATRPDCLPEDVLSLLSELKTQYPDKFIWVELGLQTIHEQTAAYIRRGYSLSCFETAFHHLQALQIPVIVHVILGLPGETKHMMLETISYLNCLRPFGIKLQLLHVLKNTDLEKDYLAGKFEVLTKENYLSIICDCLTHLSPDIVIHRVTGDGPKKILIAPLWSGNKRDVLNSLHKQLRDTGAFQGQDFKEGETLCYKTH